ncbi:MAG: SET domain-containing protein-lysine N-methyltransferase [Candidatus Sedimenticola endophacoides]|uniref:SET domain-containing protein-lysine N-methyltransferase n=1 Tax=Candidatus Sedimenticola endophacoides TaxID=2548426 RepID=A0A657PUN1_9GAMM|nr:MAG: SET domain-containing protein-lysine N-methyltransferase [Candidatus Sedimenticola endophacoides]OQX34776.1 MAG: SET domain-containing protein-lysine N-methyltransferase [Candidatus Sedimenticola endophacoides]OQX36515.1 MAG: SET domain-containing protein-lysine N-methyltransferase [Candidatus Sedimenticola endophacoides]OQX40949.1 MAG: SET domain-containing protein-lysine N-methyltransferase [Candidatus Sedimenticola endophacoides]OQX42244.1 MAG: SET domain-containing protein-lysine N-
MVLRRKRKDSDLEKVVYSAPSEIHGTGLFARRKIKAGQYIGTYHGPKTKKDDTYVLWVYDPGDEENAVGRDGKNLLRYLNHDDAGNAEFDGFDLYAIDVIGRDEEITFNYEGDTGGE